jgi:DNA-binding transcriptional MocR family regulator
MTHVERRHALVELAARNRITIVEDDPYRDLYFSNAPPPSVFAMAQDHPDARNWFVYIAGISKIVSPCLRVGWILLPPSLIAPFTVAKQANDLQSSTLNQLVAQRYLASGCLGRQCRMIAASAPVHSTSSRGSRLLSLADNLHRSFADVAIEVVRRG